MYAGNSPLMFVDPDGEWFGYLFGMMPGAVSEKNQWTGKMFGAGIGLIGKDLKKEETWTEFVDDARFIAMTYLSYSGGFGFEFGNSWYINAVEAGLSYGTTNVASDMLAGKHMSWENSFKSFGNGFVQGAGTYLGGRLIDGASPTFLKEYGLGEAEIKTLITGDIKGYVMARGLDFGFEHFHVFFKEGENLKNIGITGKGNNIFGPARIDRDLIPEGGYRAVRALTQRQLDRVRASIKQTASHGYVLPFNNCVHACRP